MKHTTPTSLRRPEERYAARALADQILAADSRRARVAELNRGRPNGTKRRAPVPDRGPTPLRLSDLARLHPLAPRGRGGR
jgi:hypothetical protein